jgi:metal-sulfur cluster biosynthetic enzyme
MTTEEKIYEALTNVIDPELGLPITDLGLIYDVKVEDKKAEIKVTLTSMGCPLAGAIVEQVREAAEAVDEIGEALVEIVWDPPWSIDMMSDEARMRLGML